MPSTSLEFPFEYASIEGLGKLFYPIVKAKIRTVFGWREFEFLVDTGADVTTVPSHLLPVLGINKNSLPSNTTKGVGGITIESWEFKLSLKLGRTQLLISCSAVKAGRNSMPLLLGRKDIFEEKYSLLVDSKRKLTVLSVNL